eukprot:scaffold139_cov325-Pavlova_lutheri.AAC.27
MVVSEQTSQGPSTSYLMCNHDACILSPRYREFQGNPVSVFDMSPCQLPPSLKRGVTRPEALTIYTAS